MPLRFRGNPRSPLGRLGHQPLRVSHQTTPAQVFLTRDTQAPMSHSSTKGELPLRSQSPWSTRKAPMPMPRRSRVSALFTVSQKTDLTPYPHALRGYIRRGGSSTQVSPAGNVVSARPTSYQCAQRIRLPAQCDMPPFYRSSLAHSSTVRMWFVSISTRTTNRLTHLEI